MTELTIPQSTIDELLATWLKEDIPSFDYGGFVVGQSTKTAFIYQKSPGVMCGQPFVTRLFILLDCQITWHFTDGQMIILPENTDRVAVATVTGPAHKLLQGERVALNLMARASGISTRAHRLLQIRINNKWGGVVAGTRKTTPGFRIVEKYAMLVGGVDTHRIDLSAMCMLKDNHVWANGSISKAVQMAKRVCGFSIKIEVECRSLDEALEAVRAGADIVMLDNFEPADAATCANKIKEVDRKVVIEVSGGLTEDTAGSFMLPNVDVLSLGCLSQSVPHVDFSMKIQRDD